MTQRNGFGDRIQKIAKNFSAKSGEMVESAKLSGEISKLQLDIEDLQFEMGQAYFKNHRDDEGCELYDFILKIIEKEKEIRARDIRLLAHKGLAYCPECDSVVGVRDEFCSKCGIRVCVNVELENIEQCRNCGGDISPEATYCARCGIMKLPQ